MLRINWTQRGLINSEDGITQLILDANKCRPNLSGFDTETTGLHILLDKPFLVQFGFVNTKTMRGYTYLLDLENTEASIDRVVKTFWEISNITKYLIGANIKYDLHMMRNIGLEYPHKNVSELQVMIRLTTVALPVKKGGEKLALKTFASRHIEEDARFYEDQVKDEKSKLLKHYNKQLKLKLKEAGIHWKDVEKTLNDSINRLEDLGETFNRVYKEWYDSLPEQLQRNMTEHIVTSDSVPYSLLDREIVLEYADYDVIYTLESAVLLLPRIKTMGQTGTFERENALILPLYRMEQMGFEMNTDYILESYAEVHAYIIERREEFKGLTKSDITCNQNAEIKRILNEKYNAGTDSTDKEALEDLLGEFNKIGNKEGARFVMLVQELRTLEKWYKTYLMRFVKDMKLTDTVYTQINQALPVTGRLSSNFQQFPKGSIKKENGEELFNPRRMVKAPKGYAGLAFLDYSQIELRFQALYTILIGSPDTNLCRAYMPFKCYTTNAQGDQRLFNYNNPYDIENWENYEWFLEETEEPWHPTDVHAATTKEAFPDLDPESDEFATLRGIVGKRTNFAKNYGAQRKVIENLLYGLTDYNFTEEDVDRVDQAYYKAFPGIKDYQKYCYKIARQGFMTNLFGRRYLKISGHNGINALIQGSAADFLKEAIIKLDAYIIENNLKTRMVINIHDEICFAVYDGEQEQIFTFKELMEKFDKTKVPIVADVEFTTTTWDEKKEYNNVEDIIKACRA